MIEENHSAQVFAKAPDDEEFAPLKRLSRKEMYNLIAKFIQKAIPIKGAELSIIHGLQNRVSTPKAPYITLQITDQKKLSCNETSYTDTHKIIWSRRQVNVHISFVGTDNVPALEMADAFDIRFNDSWASEQFTQYSDILFPLYSDDVQVEGEIINSEDQVNDVCSVNAYFEYHPELGVYALSAKEIVMNVNIIS